MTIMKTEVILSGLEEQKLEKIIVAEDISSVDNNLEEDDGDLNEIKKRYRTSHCPIWIKLR